jgi:hypothetical protein
LSAAADQSTIKGLQKITDNKRGAEVRFDLGHSLQNALLNTKWLSSKCHVFLFQGNIKVGSNHRMHGKIHTGLTPPFVLRVKKIGKNDYD